MLRRLFGGKSRRRKEEEEESKRVELLRELSAFRNTCKENIKNDYNECQERVRQNDPLTTRMAIYNASLMKKNEALLRKCDRTLLNLQTGDLRRKSATVDRVNQMEFNASYRHAKRSARKSNVSNLRRRAMKMERYGSIQNGNRALINDTLQDMFEEDDDSDDDADAAELVNSVRENQVIESILAAPNPNLTSVDLGEREDAAAPAESGIHDDV